MEEKTGNKGVIESLREFVRSHKILYNTMAPVRNFVKGVTLSRSIISLVQYGIIAKASYLGSRYYQPVYGNAGSSSKRECEDRWNVMKDYLPQPPFSFLDVGCEIGYFTFKANECGAVTIGVERDRRAYDLANAIKRLRHREKTTFYNMEIDEQTSAGLPCVDVLCSLSIYHHWVREGGFEGADRIFSNLCDRTHALFFETGQPDEKISWAAKLTFMEPDIKAWIMQYLHSKGFEDVRCLGEFSTHKSEVPRFLFYAAK